MTKSKIIMADLDAKYLFPLEIKFLKEFGETADVIAITDKEYFDEYFALPKSADILLVSNELYSAELGMHSIGNVFVLSDGSDMPDVTSNVNFISKYTSINEIFSQVTSASSNTVKEKQTRIITFYSATGGTGKTTLAMGVAAALAKRFKKVLYINAESVNVFQHRLQDKQTFSTVDSARLATKRIGIYGGIKPFIRTEMFSYMPPFPSAISSLGMNMNIYETIATEAKSTKEYDAIIVDCDSSFREEKPSLFAASDRVFVVLHNSRLEAEATADVMNCISNRDKFLLICNDYSGEENEMEKAGRGIKIDEYVAHIEGAANMSVKELGENKEIQKLSYLMD